ncbi:hypothetical protein K4K61_005205 [Colletotrichum sp. SAR11_59]|nr:hypothetical protein K4K61_005205 [Colletotrichum sp. SAR11_59]
MPTISPSRPTPLIQKSRLISSIAELEETVKETQAAADLIETEIAYKDAEIDGLKRDRISHSGSTKRFDDAITQIRVKIQQLCDKFDETIDTLAALRERLEKKKAKLAAIAPVESTDAPDPKDDEEAAALLEITSTPWEQVFVTSDDGKTFVWPAMLRGVPSTPITEDGPYWVPTWTKFVDAMDADRLQRQYEDDVDERHERMLRGPLTDEEKEDFDKRDRRHAIASFAPDSDQEAGSDNCPGAMPTQKTKVFDNYSSTHARRRSDRRGRLHSSQEDATTRVHNPFAPQIFCRNAGLYRQFRSGFFLDEGSSLHDHEDLKHIRSI